MLEDVVSVAISAHLASLLINKRGLVKAAARQFGWFSKLLILPYTCIGCVLLAGVDTFLLFRLKGSNNGHSQIIACALQIALEYVYLFASAGS